MDRTSGCDVDVSRLWRLSIFVNFSLSRIPGSPRYSRTMDALSW
jgi:hypothetical protein